MIISINAFFALAIGMGLVHYFRPGTILQANNALKELSNHGKNLYQPINHQKINFFETFKSYIPTNFSEPFVQNSLIHIILLPY